MKYLICITLMAGISANAETRSCERELDARWDKRQELQHNYFKIIRSAGKSQEELYRRLEPNLQRAKQELNDANNLERLERELTSANGKVEEIEFKLNDKEYETYNKPLSPEQKNKLANDLLWAQRQQRRAEET